MALVSMERTPKEVKEELKEIKEGTDMPKYPWGLELRLGDEEIKKLGIALPTAGAQMQIEAIATVSSVGSHQEVDNEACSHVCLQITALDVKPMATQSDRAAKIYGKSE